MLPCIHPVNFGYNVYKNCSKKKGLGLYTTSGIVTAVQNIQ